MRLEILELAVTNMQSESPPTSHHDEQLGAARSESSVRSPDGSDEKKADQPFSSSRRPRPSGLGRAMTWFPASMSRAVITRASLIVLGIVAAAVFHFVWTPDSRKEPTDESRPAVGPLFAIGQRASDLWQKATVILDDVGVFQRLRGDSVGAQASAAIVKRVREGLADGDAATASSGATIAAADCTQAHQLTPAAAVVGDSLRIRVFEEPRVAKSGPGDRGLDLSALVFERLDLSGSYAVDERGELSMPLLGRIDAAGHSLACIEQLVADRYRKAFSSKASVSASFGTRQPVFVSGAVRSPGSYTLTPGMTIRHVLALAGTNADAPGASQTISNLSARRLELLHLRVGLNLEISRIQAAMELRTTMDIDPEQRKELDSILGERRVSSEFAALASTVRAYELERESAQSHVDELALRVKLLQEQQSVAQAQIDNKRRHLKRLQPLSEKGLAPLTQMQSEEQREMDLQQLGLKISLDLDTAQDAYNVARRELEQSEPAYQRKLSNELRDRLKELNGIEAQIASVSMQLDNLGQGQDEGSGSSPGLLVIRQSANGSVRFAADKDTELFPGDMLEVGAESVKPETVARAASDPAGVN